MNWTWYSSHRQPSTWEAAAGRMTTVWASLGYRVRRATGRWDENPYLVSLSNSTPYLRKEVRTALYKTVWDRGRKCLESRSQWQSQGEAILAWPWAVKLSGKGRTELVRLKEITQGRRGYSTKLSRLDDPEQGSGVSCYIQDREVTSHWNLHKG